MLSARLGHFLDKPLGSLAQKIRISPNALSLSGFLVTLVASYALVYNLFIGGILIIAGGCFDILDGVVARVNNRSTKFGAFLDSVLDRYSDAFIFIGIALYLGKKGDRVGVLLCLGVLVGAFLISYARARAEGLGVECTQGLLERPERIILIVFGTLSGLIKPVLWIMVVLTHFTVLQRIYSTWKGLSKKDAPFENP